MTTEQNQKELEEQSDRIAEQILTVKSFDLDDDEQKYAIATIVAMHIEKRYEFRFVKCLALVMDSKWWNSHLDKEHIINPDIEEIEKSVFQQIDNNEIS